METDTDAPRTIALDDLYLGIGNEVTIRDRVDGGTITGIVVGWFPADGLAHEIEVAYRVMESWTCSDQYRCYAGPFVHTHDTLRKYRVVPVIDVVEIEGERVKIGAAS